jgi:hypothetical protein
MDLLIPHWLMIAGAALVAIGFLGLFTRNRQGPEPTAPRSQMPPLPTLLDSSRGKDSK